jgi:hypothetical protein
MLSGKPFFTRSRIKKILIKAVIPFLAVYAVAALITAARDNGINNEEYAAVLLSDHALTRFDYWASPAAFLGSYLSWSYYFNNQNIKTKWFLRAKSMDLEKVIRDPKCRSMVLVGHGNLNAWRATDRRVTNFEVEKMMTGIAMKKGEWLQLTCGEEDFSPVRMGELVMETGNVYTYRGPATFYDFAVDAISGFKLLKDAGK